MWHLQILGTNSAVPVRDRHPSAQILITEKESFLVDCGEGTQMRMIENGVKRSRINHIFISHLHGDHIFGLPGLLSSYTLFARNKPMHLYGPSGISAYVTASFSSTGMTLSYPLEIHEHGHDGSALVLETKDTFIRTIPLDHRIPATGYLFNEKLSKRRMRSKVVAEYQIPYADIESIKDGKDLQLNNGQIISNALLTIKGKEPQSFAYCSDTAYNPKMVDLIANVDLLYHEATFLEELKNEAQKRRHSTARQAGKIASAAKVGKLLIGHFSSRYKDLDPLLKEAREIFQNTHLAYEGLLIPVR